MSKRQEVENQKALLKRLSEARQLLFQYGYLRDVENMRILVRIREELKSIETYGKPPQR